jgi:hypothetical protein
MSRYAYPASSERQDVSIHGSASSATDVKLKTQQEAQLERLAEFPTCPHCKRDIFTLESFALTRKS